MDTSTPLVLVPGHLCDQRIWEGILPILRPLFSRIITPLPTYADGLVRGIRQLLNELPDRFVLLGFSMGGIAALEIVRQAPTRVVALILAGTNPGPDLPERAALRPLQQKQAAREGVVQVLRDHMLPTYFAQANKSRADLSELCETMADAVGLNSFLQQSEVLRTRPGFRSMLSSIRAPTMLICGEEDRVCLPQWHREMHAAIRGSMFQTIACAGHMVVLEQPEEFGAAVVGWWSNIVRSDHEDPE